MLEQVKASLTTLFSARSTRIPPNSLLFLDYSDKLRHQLVPLLRIPFPCKTPKERCHIPWPPSGAGEEEVGEACGGVERESVRGEVGDDLGGGAEGGGWRIIEEVVALRAR
jgi:hypothetical protein